MVKETLFVAVTAVLAVTLIVFELYAPARKYERGIMVRSYVTNLLLFGANNLFSLALHISSVFLIVVLWSPTGGIFTALPLWMQGVFGVVILDASIWLWHMLNHKVSMLWTFHKCHHSEQYLNATSALRFHIGELLLSVLWKSMVLILVGIPLWVFVLSEFLLTACALLHHANITFQPRVQRYIELIFVTPYWHRVHHSTIRSEHDSNYGVIFTWWDRIFHTVVRVTPAQIGLQNIPEKLFYSFLTFPFRKN